MCLCDSGFLNFVSTFDIFFLCETWQTNRTDYEIEGYESICIPRPESVNGTSKRGHGGICLFYSTFLSKGIMVVETDSSG